MIFSSAVFFPYNTIDASAKTEIHSFSFTEQSNTNDWNLPNGVVTLPKSITNFPNHDFRNPILLGSGGGGAVFSVKDSQSNDDFALKVSWTNSAESVRTECEILNTLEKAQSNRHVEICIGIESYSKKNDNRVMIALQPVVDNPVASVFSLNEKLQSKCVRSIIETMVDFLTANIVTTDVQALINQETGDFWLIDLTEAREMITPPSFLDLALANSFLSELITLIPDQLMTFASKILLEELVRTESGKEHKFSRDILELLQNQNSIMSNSETLEFIQSRLNEFSE
jgi:hypothetical protein